MEARLPQGTTLRKVFDAIREMITDVNLECAPTGIALQAMDASHVSLVALGLKKQVFDNYHCDRDRTLGINMQAVCKVFKMCGPDDSVILRHVDGSDRVSFVFETTGEERVSDFSLKLMSLEEDHLKMPEAEFASSVKMPSKHLQKIILDLSQFSDTINVEVDSKHIKFSAKGDLGGGNVVLKPRITDGEKVEIQATENVSLMFATRYLGYIMKAAGLADSVELCMSNGQPLQVTYPLFPDAAGYLRYYLAPKMNDDQMGGDA